MLIAGAILVSLPIALGLYAYLLYPALLRLLAARRVLTDGRTDTGAMAGAHPMVTIVVPAYNEAHQIGETIQALLVQDYLEA